MAYLSSFPVRRLHVWTGAFIIIGISLTLGAVLDFLAGESSIWQWVVALSGLLMVVGAAYEASTRDPDEYKISGYWLGLVLFGALLSLAGIILQLLGL